MKKIGIIDYFIDEWHSNTYLGLFKKATEELGLDYIVSYAYAEIDCFENRLTTDEWCKENNVERCYSIEELCEKSDNILILSPANPEKHLLYAKTALRYKKATYIDKTFAENVDVAKEIYQIANTYGTKIFSTSALRYAEELDGLDNVNSVVITGGGRSIEEYIVHQIEMAVKLMGENAKTVRLFDRGNHSTVIVDFDGKLATLNYSYGAPFVVDASIKDKSPAIYLPITKNNYFDRLIKDILTFFESQTPPFDYRQTITVIAVRDAIIKAKALPFGQVVEVVK